MEFVACMFGGLYDSKLPNHPIGDLPRKRQSSMFGILVIYVSFEVLLLHFAAYIHNMTETVSC